MEILHWKEIETPEGLRPVLFFSPTLSFLTYLNNYGHSNIPVRIAESTFYDGVYVTDVEVTTQTPCQKQYHSIVLNRDFTLMPVQNGTVELAKLPHHDDRQRDYESVKLPHDDNNDRGPDHESVTRPHIDGRRFHEFVKRPHIHGRRDRHPSPPPYRDGDVLLTQHTDTTVPNDTYGADVYTDTLPPTTQKICPKESSLQLWQIFLIILSIIIILICCFYPFLVK